MAYVLHCRNCGYAYTYDFKSDRDAAETNARYCVCCKQTVNLENGGEVDDDWVVDDLYSYNHEREIAWQNKLHKKEQDEEKAKANRKIYTLVCQKCGYHYPYSSQLERDKDRRSKKRCSTCNNSVRLDIGPEMTVYRFNEINNEKRVAWQKKQAAKKKKSKISIITGTILTALTAISGFVIAFLEEIKALLAQASSLILEIVDIVSNFFSSIG